MKQTPRFAFALVGFLASGVAAHATKLVDVRTVDDQFVMVQWADSRVRYQDDGKGPSAFIGGARGDGDVFVAFGKPLDTALAGDAKSFTIASTDDPAYRQPAKPAQAFRKTKVNGTKWAWPDPECAIEHTIFLKLPRKLQQGKRYTVTFAPGLNSDAGSRSFTFDAYKTVSEAVHTNIVGYASHLTAMKSADLYMWLGDGGPRDYSGYVGKKVVLVNAKTGAKHDVGKVKFWKKSGPDFGKWDLTKSDVWTCDFSSFTGTGRFRLAVEGVGCSPEFELRRDAYRKPFATSVVGFYFMRLGESKDFAPVPRQPRFIPNVDPPKFKVVRTTFGPFHPEWRDFGGDTWDMKDWYKYAEPGNPTNPNAYGGHSDAADWDRHAGHISIIWDMILPYLLSDGKIGDDNLGIKESGNGLPDILDEARNEVDFWLRLRDGKGGYSMGVNNPLPDHSTMFQAAAHPYMAWGNALNAAMLADAFRIAGKKDLQKRYLAAAVEAWNRGGNDGLDASYGIGNGTTRGRDLKMMAAAHLYNLTGDRKYEDAFAKECVVTSPTSRLIGDKYTQTWGAAAYLMAAKRNWRPIHYPKLLANLKAAVTLEARTRNVLPTTVRPSRRSSTEEHGWFQATQSNQLLLVAHAIADKPADRESFLRAMILEADYGLGRNPMNMVQMTGLGSRHPVDVYTSGWNDGYPGSHPGHTPYMNSENWGPGFMADPKYYANKGYPAWTRWPHGEALWNARYCYSNNEFTPQQTMGCKTALLGYLYSLR